MSATGPFKLADSAMLAATNGACPGRHPFGGWNGSGTTGKAIGSFHHLQQYPREQSRTIVD